MDQARSRYKMTDWRCVQPGDADPCAAERGSEMVCAETPGALTAWRCTRAEQHDDGVHVASWAGSAVATWGSGDASPAVVPWAYPTSRLIVDIR